MTMKTYSLPQTLKLGDKEFDIRSDWRAVYDICQALQDNLSVNEKSYVLLQILFRKPNTIPDNMLETAIESGMWFVSGGNPSVESTNIKLFDWCQDFPLIISAVNKVAGFELRAARYTHWWTFLGFFQEIDDCLFSRVVAIRSKLSRKEKLDKSEQKFYKANRSLIVFKNKETNKPEPSATLKRVLGIF